MMMRVSGSNSNSFSASGSAGYEKEGGPKLAEDGGGEAGGGERGGGGG